MDRNNSWYLLGEGSDLLCFCSFEVKKVERHSKINVTFLIATYSNQIAIIDNYLKVFVQYKPTFTLLYDSDNMFMLLSLLLQIENKLRLQYKILIYTVNVYASPFEISFTLSVNCI